MPKPPGMYRTLLPATHLRYDGVKLYYEVYGTGEPLLIVHGNGGNIASVKAQIEHFRTPYRVIAMDTRDHGRSAGGRDKITCAKMTGDLAALLDHLKTGPVNVLGWSDGGIEALLLGIHYPAKLKKIAAMAANLDPSEAAVYPEVIGLVKSMLNSMPATERETAEGSREQKVTRMMLEKPHIAVTELAEIAAPTLVWAGDHDLIRDEHTLVIFHRIPNSQLCIFPGSTHMAPFDDAALLNAAMERSLREPYVTKDRVQDTLKSLESLRAA